MCKILKVSQSCYYQWIKQGSIVHKVDEQLNELIKEIFEQSRQTYGTRRIRESLMKKYGLVISLNKISKIMKHLNLQVKMRRRFRVVTTDSNHNYPIAPNRLDRDFYSSAANNTYVGDITYIPTREGWLYLATVIDLYSRKVVGWSMDDTMKVSLVNDALEMAIKRRKPSKGLVWHTDRRSQYASYSHKDLLKQHGIIQSMSKKGDCWDNAVSESFFHTLKTEFTHHENFQPNTRSQITKEESYFHFLFLYHQIQQNYFLYLLSVYTFYFFHQLLGYIYYQLKSLLF